MREDRRSEPGLANGRVEADRMQESIQALRPPSNPMLFVHPCCTNSGLGVPTRLPTKCRCPRHHITRAKTTKAIRCFVHSGCTNSGLRRSPEILPESVCVAVSPKGPVTCSRLLDFAIATSFAFCSLNVKLLFVLVGLHLRPTCFSALWPTGLKLPCVRARFSVRALVWRIGPSRLEEGHERTRLEASPKIRVLLTMASEINHGLSHVKP